MKSHLVTQKCKCHARREDGAISVLNLFFLMAVGILAGVAIDVSSLVSARSQLQVTADAAAHAALVEREWEDIEVAKAKAVSLAQNNMPTAKFGDVLTEENIQFGSYDRATEVFTVDDNSRNAVLVKTERLTTNGNPVSSFLLQFVGFWNWDVRTTSVFETFYPTCLMEGFVADGVIDVQSNNSYFNGFCMHSNSHVTINNNNYFEPGTIVSMPDTNDLVVTTNGNDEPKNDGLEEALREGKYFIKILSRLDKIVEGIKDRDSRYARDYINNYNINQITAGNGNNTSVSFAKATIDPSDLMQRRVNTADCSNELTLGPGTYENVVLISECNVKISNNVILTNATLITKGSVNGSHIVLGVDDGCAAGGGAQLLAYGEVAFSSQIELYGGQIIAVGDIDFQANGDGMKGASIVSGGNIDSTSNLNFGFCGTGMEHSFLAEYFRLAG